MCRRFILCVGLLAALGSWATTAWAAQERPNVVLIMTDDQGWWDVGANGNPDIETPVMDGIARDGVMFTRFYASPVCAPTRASLMTGRYFHRTGVFDTFMGRDTLNAHEITLAQMFQRQGYKTGMYGKWHLGRYMKYHPVERGFEEYLGFWQYGFINRYFDSDELFYGKTPVITEGYVTDVLTDAAISFMKRNADEPFFVYLPYNVCHYPFLVPDKYIDKYLKKGLSLTNARIYGMLDNADENIGRVLKTLDEIGATDDTLVIFMTDNGGISDHFRAGLRGQKGTVYEGGVRVPFFARWPGHFPAGAKVDAMAQHIDIFPTLCEVIGAKLPTDRKIDGKSLLSLLKAGQGESPHDYLYHQWCRVRPRADKSWAIRDRQYKLVNGELFDLLADPGEKRDLAADKPEIVKRLRSQFLTWFEDVTAGRDFTQVPIEVGRADENPVEIDLTWGQTVGEKVQPQYRHYNRDYMADWTVVGDAVRWKIDVTQPGRYEVIFNYACPVGEGGSTFTVSCGDARFDGKVSATGGLEVYRPETVGTVELPAGPATLEVRLAERTGEFFMNLHRVWMKRVE